MLSTNLTQRAMDKNALTALKIELLYKCNLNCVHCYVGDKKAETYPPHLEQYIKILKQAKKLGVYDIAITGGEPFMYEFWRELFLVIKQMGFNLTILSNGTFFEEKDISFLKEISVDLLRISRYGLSRETYDRTTRRPGAFEIHTRNIKLLEKYRIPHNFSNIILSTNESDAMEMMTLDGQAELNIMSDYNQTGAPLAYRPSMGVLKECLRIRDSDVKLESVFRVGDGEIIDGGSSMCNAGKMCLSISCNGDIYPCTQYRVKVGNILVDSLEDVWNSDALSVAREQLDVKYFKKCSECEYKGHMYMSCPGENFNGTGDFYTPPDYKCEMCKISYDSKENTI